MIIGRDFVWLHFPKCAGSHTERVLQKYFSTNKEIVFDIIDPKNIIWHESVPERERRTGVNLRNKSVICNFRRLPSWMISRIQFEEKRSGFTTTKDQYTRGRFHEASGYLNFADTYARKYSSPPVRSWIRTENIGEDFEKAFSPFLDLSGIDLSKEFRTRSNVTQYEKDLHRWFDPKDLDILYSSCPVWRDLEREIYGNLLEL